MAHPKPQRKEKVRWLLREELLHLPNSIRGAAEQGKLIKFVILKTMQRGKQNNSYKKTAMLFLEHFC